MTSELLTTQPKPTGAANADAKVKARKATRPVQLRKLLTRKIGVTITQIQTAFGWQPHTARAALSGLRKRGEIVERREAPKGSVYRIVSVEAVT